MALNSLICADVPLRSCSLTHVVPSLTLYYFVVLLQFCLVIFSSSYSKYFAWWSAISWGYLDIVVL